MEIRFAISGKCNFVCPYCYQTYRKDREVINDKRADKFINFVKKYVDQNNIRKIHLAYYGGEPLLAFNEITINLSFDTSIPATGCLQLHSPLCFIRAFCSTSGPNWRRPSSPSSFTLSVLNGLHPSQICVIQI